MSVPNSNYSENDLYSFDRYDCFFNNVLITELTKYDQRNIFTLKTFCAYTEPRSVHIKSNKRNTFANTKEKKIVRYDDLMWIAESYETVRRLIAPKEYFIITTTLQTKRKKAFRSYHLYTYCLEILAINRTEQRNKKNRQEVKRDAKKLL